MEEWIRSLSENVSEECFEDIKSIILSMLEAENEKPKSKVTKEQIGAEVNPNFDPDDPQSSIFASENPTFNYRYVPSERGNSITGFRIANDTVRRAIEGGRACGKPRNK